MWKRTIATLLAGLVASGGAAMAQAYGVGPAGTIPGSSMSGARIVGTPQRDRGARIPNARVFGDTFEERAFGTDYDDSFITPEVPRGTRRARSNEEIANEGRPSIDPGRAVAFARQGPTAIGRSSVTRGSTFSRSRGGRARIVPSP